MPDLRIVQGRWNDVVRRVLRDGHPALAAALGEAAAIAVDAATITATAPPARLPALEDARAQQALMAAFQAVLGLPLQLLPRPGAAAAAPGAERMQRWREATDHPLVKDIMRRFEAEPVHRELIARGDWLARLAEERAGPNRRLGSAPAERTPGGRP